MLSWIVLFLLDGLGCLAPRFCFLLINSHPFAGEEASLRSLLYKLSCVVLRLGLFVVERRCEINLHISINDTNCIILILGFDLQYIDVKFSRKSRYLDRIALMQAGKIPQLKLQHSFGVV